MERVDSITSALMKKTMLIRHFQKISLVNRKIITAIKIMILMRSTLMRVQTLLMTPCSMQVVFLMMTTTRNWMMKIICLMKHLPLVSTLLSGTHICMHTLHLHPKEPYKMFHTSYLMGLHVHYGMLAITQDKYEEVWMIWRGLCQQPRGVWESI